MAYTKILPIKTEAYISNAIEYGKSDKEKSEYEKTHEENALKYIQRDKEKENIIVHTVSSAINCTPNNAKKIFDRSRQIYENNNSNKKAGCNVGYHLIQNFGEKLNSDMANDIGKQLAEKLFPNHSCVISTHNNTGFTHNHIIINAWSIDGKNKVNDCLQLKRDIRKASDELCREYDLKILEDTKNMNVVKYKDKDGVTRFYEKTDRKEKIKRKNIRPNSFKEKNEANYFYKKEKCNRDVIKDDIDKIIMQDNVISLESLLRELRKIGYKIKDKNADGQWRKFISFKATLQEKYTRDKSIGEEYTKEMLAERIINKVIIREENMENNFHSKKAIKFFDVYNINDINDIDIDYRAIKDINNDDFKIVMRGKIEKAIIIDMRETRASLMKSTKNSNDIKLIEVDLREHNYNDYLVSKLKNNLNTLSFIEKNKITSLGEINNTVRNLKSKQVQAKEAIYAASKVLAEQTENIKILDRYNELKIEMKNMRSASHPGENDFKKIEIINEFDVVGQIVKDRKLDNIDDKFREKIELMNKKLDFMKEEMTSINNKLNEYKKCMRTFKGIDNESFIDDINEFEEIYADNKEKQEKAKNNEKEK